MHQFDYDIGIIGGGAAGLTVASGAAQLGAKTLLIEKEQQLGGDCLHFGCVPSKTLIKTAHVYHLMARGPEFGLPAVDRQPVDFTAIRRRIKEVIAVIQRHDSVERFCKLGVKTVFGEPCFTDPHTVDLDGKAITAKTWVLATGSSAAIPPLPGLDTTPYITNREIFSLDRLPESLIVLGAGPIACEMAQSFRRLGSRVTVLQRSGQILSREDADLAAMVQQNLEAEGVIFHLNCTITAVGEGDGRRQVSFTSSDGRQQTVAADQLLVALGRAPNLDGLNLDGIGVTYDRRGITVNKSLHTAQKHIYAAGDCIGGLQFTHVAGYEGGIVVANAVFHLPRKVDYSTVPWCTYTRPELASIGLNEKAARKAGYDYTVWTEEFSNSDRALAEGETAGRIKLLLDSKEKPLGIQILGPHAGDLLGEWLAVMNGNIGLSKIASAIHPYPTLGEINKKVSGAVLAPKIFSDTVKKGLKFFFSLKGRACGE